MQRRPATHQLLGRWVRTASERGPLTCRFDADGCYCFAIAGRNVVTESGTYRVVSGPSELAGRREVHALLLRTDEGLDTAIVLSFVDGEMFLDGQRWQPVSPAAQLPVA